MERDNWKVVVVNDGNEALRLLKMRNWDAVLLEDDLPEIDGAACIEAFREWEEEHRVNRQCNTILVCSEGVPAPSDVSAIVQSPTGFDSVLARPLVYTDMEYLLNVSKSGGRAYEIVIRNG
jgi:CheY-like chemotaxis protein